MIVGLGERGKGELCMTSYFGSTFCSDLSTLIFRTSARRTCRTSNELSLHMNSARLPTVS